MDTLVVGAVAYDPKVVLIWDIIKDYANATDCKLDYVLFSNYERQVSALLSGHIDIAWNTNVAWIRCLHASAGKAKALVMRDTDKNFTTKFIKRKSSAISKISDLKGKSFGLGSLDSAQAAILSLHYLKQEAGDMAICELTSLRELQADCINIIRFNSDVGKHGDTGRSEFDVLDSIKKGQIDAGSVGSSTWIRILQEGGYEDLECFYTTEGYCHCNFTCLESLNKSAQDAFVWMLLSQNTRKNESLITKMMQMEGLNQWIKVTNQELKGYEVLQAAMQEQGILKA
ncbi:MAG: PhnD/SsuA/transferrin family substrate-binding protein [Helicobacter sp.]|nr:PhnD/SsuA/transferrin family substrate-binding protein [Helicobacter sp.]MDY5740945.1 PhnD/SsuA/transferrin family substrate-binding protein [Helicobacter sp.]